MKNRVICIDPSYSIYSNDNIFNIADATLNRDDQLLPFQRLREKLSIRNIPVHTSDFIPQNIGNVKYEYFSMGLLGYERLLHRPDVNLRAFMILEPPLVAPRLYKKLPQLTEHFQFVYIFNTVGNGYSLNGVNVDKLREIKFPLPYCKPREDEWLVTDRLNKMVVIAGNHNPRFRSPEFYSARIDAIAELSKFNAIDLYGKGWSKWYSKQALWPKYWANRSKILNTYRGECVSKFAILSKYKFSLCFENSPMDGYITEKIFDCFYSGTVPLYLGAPDVDKFIPGNCFIDVRKFDNLLSLWNSIKSMPDAEWRAYRAAARDFVSSPEGLKYFNSLDTIVGQSGSDF